MYTLYIKGYCSLTKTIKSSFFSAQQIKIIQLAYDWDTAHGS